MVFLKKVKLSQIVIVLFLLSTVMLIWRYKSSKPVHLNISPYVHNVVADNYAQYSKLSYVDFENEDEIRLGFRTIIASMKSSELTKDLNISLADFLSELFLSKGAGDFDRYKRCVQLNAKPIPFDEVKSFYKTWFNRNPPDTKDALKLAREMYNLEVQYNNGKHLFDGCSFDENAFRMKCIRISDSNAHIDTLGDLTEDQKQYWLGPIASGVYHFFAPDIQIEEVLHEHGSVIWVDFQIVVRTKGGDMYPPRIRLWYHPDINQWILDGFSKQSTIRGVTDQPEFVF